MAGWQKGQSGNPKGRPRKERSLSLLLEAGGDAPVSEQDATLRKERLRDLVWQAAVQGRVKLGRKVLEVKWMNEWLEIVRFIYTQTDGPPRLDVDVTSDGEVLTFLALVQAAQPPEPPA